jgi:hypothetical protein
VTQHVHGDLIHGIWYRIHVYIWWLLIVDRLLHHMELLRMNLLINKLLLHIRVKLLLTLVILLILKDLLLMLLLLS